MNNATSVGTILVNEVPNTNSTSYSRNYLSVNNAQIKNFPSNSLADRKLIIKPSIALEELPDTLLDMLFSKLDIQDLYNISLTCKKLLFCSRYYLNNFHTAHDLFNEYSTVSQKKIIRLFNKENYHKCIKSWLANFNDATNILNHLDSMQNIDNFHKLLFFYATKSIQQATSIKVTTKFTQIYDDISQSVGLSSSNNSLFVANFDGVIKIYSLDKNKNFTLCYQNYLGRRIEYAKFSPDGYTIAVSDIDKKITIIYSTENNNWAIEDDESFNDLEATSISFSPNSKFMISFYRNNLCFAVRSDRSTKWRCFHRVHHTHELSAITYSSNNEYYAYSDNRGYVSIELLAFMVPLRLLHKIEEHAYPITSFNFSVNSKFFAVSDAYSTTKIYQLEPSNYIVKKIFSVVTKTNESTLNFDAGAYFSNDSNTLVVNHGKNITIVNNLLDSNNITKLNCKLASDLGKVYISNNSNYIIIYAQKERLIKIYTKNHKKQWFNIKDIDTKIKVKLIKFSANEHHFMAISSEKTVVYQLCECQFINKCKVNLVITNNKIKTRTNKKLTRFTIETPVEIKKHIMFNPYFCQLLVAYNDVIKIFTPSEKHLWYNKLTLQMDMPIETIQYTNNGSHILVNTNNDNQSNVKLLAVN